MRAKRMMSLALTLFLAAGITACGGSNSAESKDQESKVTVSAEGNAVNTNSETSSKYGGVMRVGVAGFDLSATLGAPYVTIGNEFILEHFAVAEPLFWLTGDGEIEWLLADGYEVSEDNLVYTFSIRDGIKFHDGSDLDAEVVAWNFNKSIELGSSSGWKSAEAIDKKHVAVTLEEPNPFFMNANATRKNLLIASKKAYDDKGEDYCYTHPVGTGPFVFESMEVGSFAKFRKNENYWRKDAEGNMLPYLDGVEFYCISDPTVAAAALANSEIDVYYGELDNFKENLETYGMDNIKEGVGPVPTRINGIRFIANGREAKLFTDQRLRQAVAYAIDGEAIAKAFKTGTVFYTEQPAVKGYPDYDDSAVVYGYEPEKAKALLAEAGYPDGFDIDLNIDTTPTAAKLAKLYQHYLGQVGINVKIMSYESAERNEIQDRDDTWSQLLVSQTGMSAGDTVYMFNTCSPSRAKYRNMLPFETEPTMIELYNKVLKSESEEEAWKNLKAYNHYVGEICAQYMFLHTYTDIHYYVDNLYPAADVLGGSVIDTALAHFIQK